MWHIILGRLVWMNGMEYIYIYIKRRVDRDNWITFVTAFVTGMLCHGYVYMGNYPTYGGLHSLVKRGSAFIRETRWLSSIIVLLDGKVTMPFFLGVVATFFWSLSIVFIIKILNQTSRFSKTLTCLGFMTYPVIASLNSFLYMADLFAISCFFAVLGVYFWYKNDERIKALNSLWSVLFFSACFAIYQPILGVALVLILICIGFELTRTDSINEVWRRIFEAIVYLVAAAILWLLGDFIFKKLLSIETVSQDLSISINSIIDGIIRCYKETYNFFFVNSFFSRTVGKIGIMSICLLVFVMIGYGIYSIRGKKLFKLRLLLILALMAVYPLAASYVFIILPNTEAVNRQFFAHILLIPLAITLAERVAFSETVKEPNMLSRIICLLVTGITICMSIFFAEVDNTAYMNASIRYERDYSLALRLVDRIEANSEYVEGMPVMIVVGDDYSYKHRASESKLDIFIPGMDQVGTTSMHNLSGIKNFVETFIQSDINIEWHQTDSEIMNTIPKWPATDCIRVIDGVMYLRLS